ncbi:zf-TFIIB domain-containing protein [Saccharomonospora sp. NPDC006951]
MRKLSLVICPKCQNVMKTVDKGGIHLEQCDGCRGIFLDHGELEQIVRAENAFYGAPAAGPPPYRPAGGPPPAAQYGGGYRDSPRPHRGYADSPRPYRGGGYGDSPRPYGGHGYGYGHGHKRRKRSFLENLFD